jgi:hypothetical protein
MQRTPPALRMVASAVPNAISPASCSTSMPVICSTFSLVRREFFSLRLFPNNASLSQGSAILLAAFVKRMCSAICGSVMSTRRISAPVSSVMNVTATLLVSMSLFEYGSSSGSTSLMSGNSSGGTSLRSANGLGSSPGSIGMSLARPLRSHSFPVSGGRLGSLAALT